MGIVNVNVYPEVQRQIAALNNHVRIITTHDTSFGYIGSPWSAYQEPATKPKDQYKLDYEEAMQELDRLIPPLFIPAIVAGGRR